MAVTPSYARVSVQITNHSRGDVYLMDILAPGGASTVLEMSNAEALEYQEKVQGRPIEVQITPL